MTFLGEVRLEDKFGAFVVFQEALGFVPNLVQAQTLLPRVVEAQAKLESAMRLRDGAISRVQKERILLGIAADRRDEYCIAEDSKVLSSLGVSDHKSMLSRTTIVTRSFRRQIWPPWNFV